MDKKNERDYNLEEIILLIKSILTGIKNIEDINLIEFIKTTFNRDYNFKNLTRSCKVIKTKISKNEILSLYDSDLYLEERRSLKKIKENTKFSFFVFKKIVSNYENFYKKILLFLEILPIILMLNYLFFKKYSEMDYLRNNLKIIEKILDLLDDNEICQSITYKGIITISPIIPILKHELRNYLSNIRGSHTNYIQLDITNSTNERNTKNQLPNILNKYWTFTIWWKGTVIEDFNSTKQRISYLIEIKSILNKISTNEMDCFQVNLINVLVELIEKEIYLIRTSSINKL